MKNENNMSEQQDQFARRLASLLVDAPLTAKQQDRLRQAGIAALEKARAPVVQRHNVLAGAWNWVQERSHDRGAWLVAAAVCLAVTIYWHSTPESWDEDVDVMLLAGELPPDAYLDDKIDSLAR